MHELELEGELALDVGRGAVRVGRAARLRVLAPPRHEHGTPLVGKPCSMYITFGRSWIVELLFFYANRFWTVLQVVSSGSGPGLV